MNWQLITTLQSSDVLEHKLYAITVLEKDILLTRRFDRLYAFSASCPHAGASLANGYIDALGCVVCPLHQYRFDVRNGFNKSGEGYKLKTYPVKEDGQQIFISLQH